MFMRVKLLVAVAGFGVLLAAAPVAAHHAFAAEFDAKQAMSLKGTITQMDWINPHAWMHLAVKNKDGKTEEWMVELGPPNGLFRRGWKKDSVPVGTEVVVFGYR